jgi:hypothetical protein
MQSKTILSAVSALAVSLACGCAAETERGTQDAEPAVGTAESAQLVNPPGYNPPGYNPVNPVLNPPGYNPPGTGVGIGANPRLDTIR